MLKPMDEHRIPILFRGQALRRLVFLTSLICVSLAPKINSAIAKPRSGTYLKVAGGAGLTLRNWYASGSIERSGIDVLQLTGKALPTFLTAPSFQVDFGFGGQSFGGEIGLRYEGNYSWNATGVTNVFSTSEVNILNSLGISLVLGPTLWWGILYFHPIVGIRYQMEYMNPVIANFDTPSLNIIYGGEVGIILSHSVNLMILARAEASSLFAGISLTPFQF